MRPIQSLRWLSIEVVIQGEAPSTLNCPIKCGAHEFILLWELMGHVHFQLTPNLLFKGCVSRINLFFQILIKKNQPEQMF